MAQTSHRALNRICLHAYDLVLTLTFIILLLAIPHRWVTHNINIAQTLPNETVIFYSNDSLLIQGDELPVYRFNPGWKVEIGKVRVEARQGAKITARYDSEEFAWPMGRQGRVVAVSGTSIRVDIGANMALHDGDHLIIFDERKNLGRIRLDRVMGDSSEGTILFSPKGSLLGKTASEFIIPTQVVYFKNSSVKLLEWLVLAIVIGLWILRILVNKPSFLVVSVNGIVKRAVALPKTGVFWVSQIMIGGLCVWFFVSFTVHATNYALDWFNAVLISYHIQGTQFGSVLQEKISWLYSIVAVLYLTVLFSRRQSPIAALWHWVQYNPDNFRWLGWVNRHALIWMLHLVIVFAFARMLVSFLIANLNALGTLGWSDAHLNFSTFGGAYHGLFYFLTHIPRIDHAEEGFQFARYGLWSISIVGCLIGYGHSVISILWGHHIRNLDFTIMGWMTNAACYPLLGVIIWQMVPPLAGQDPIITQGPLYYFVLVVELMLNLFYTLSIWNLGKRFGVMTDKGVCTSGWYSVVRHPSYTLESLMFVMMELRGVTGVHQIVAVGMYLFLYYVRSEREDVFMSHSNPDYQEYQKHTPYKFIPGVY